MRAHFLALSRQSLVYGMSGAAIQLVGLVTLPVYARAFTPAEYGVVELASVAFAALIIAVDAGIGAAMQREYFDVSADDDDGRLVVTSTATLSSVGVALVFAVGLILARVPIARWLFDDSAHADIVVLLALSVVFGTVAIFLRDIMRLRFQPGRYAISALMTSVPAAAVGVVWVLAFDGGVTAVIVGLLAGQVVSAAYGFVTVRGQVALRFSWPRLRSLLAFGLPLVPAGAGIWGISFIDRVILSRLDGLGSVGEYAVATRFGSVLMFVVGAFTTAYVPFMLSTHANEPERERELRSGLLTYAAILFAGLALPLGLFAREIAEVIAPDYDRAYRVVGILCLGVAGYGLTPITGAGITIARQTHYAMRYTLGATVVSVALCFALIPPIGLTGAALGTAVAYLSLAVLYLRRSQRLSRAEFSPGKVVRVFVLAACLMPLGLLRLDSEAATLAIKVAALAVFVAGLWTLRVVGGVESAELRRAARAVRSPSAWRRRRPLDDPLG